MTLRWSLDVSEPPFPYQLKLRMVIFVTVRVVGGISETEWVNVPNIEHTVPNIEHTSKQYFEEGA